MIEHSPIDGLLGFSQGAVVSSLLMVAQARKSLSLDNSDPSVNDILSHLTHLPHLSFAVLTSGFTPRAVNIRKLFSVPKIPVGAPNDLLHETFCPDCHLTEVADYVQVTLPTLHLYGRKDPLGRISALQARRHYGCVDVRLLDAAIHERISEDDRRRSNSAHLTQQPQPSHLTQQPRPPRLTHPTQPTNLTQPASHLNPNTKLPTRLTTSRQPRVDHLLQPPLTSPPTSLTSPPTSLHPSPTSFTTHSQVSQAVGGEIREGERCGTCQRVTLAPTTLEQTPHSSHPLHPPHSSHPLHPPHSPHSHTHPVVVEHSAGHEFPRCTGIVASVIRQFFEERLKEMRVREQVKSKI
eukprot:GHVN01029512.1.p1 GENE.GHVN01029512.1~~GHVN01029512.1.p1  ORF type:complete len:351 (-),score=127.51 GHVN01029512.1:188-1240(-)